MKAAFLGHFFFFTSNMIECIEHLAMKVTNWHSGYNIMTQHQTHTGHTVCTHCKDQVRAEHIILDFTCVGGVFRCWCESAASEIGPRCFLTNNNQTGML